MPLPNIHEIRIKGYKSLAEETRLEIRPLTILAGANSSGKSSVMQPLLLLKQTLASPSDPGVMEIAGPNVQFTEYGQMFFKCPGKGKSAKTMTVGFSIGDRMEPERVDLTYRLSDGRMLLDREEFSMVSSEGGRSDFSLQSGPVPPETVKLLPEGLTTMFFPMKGQGLFYHARAQRGFFDLHIGSREHAPISLSIGLDLPDKEVRQQLLNLIHIPDLRGNPERHYPAKRMKGPRFDGFFQDYVAGIIAGWGDALAGYRHMEDLNEALHSLGLTWKLEARKVDATRVEIMVGRMKEPRRGGARDFVNIADVGFGVSQVLPALVALIIASPGQIVHLEQPEIHLHPKAQKNLAQLLANAAKKNRRLIVETHSSILIRGIQTLVAKGELDPNLVKLHWFTRDDETGATRVSSADLDENGAFGADWPEDFDDTYLESERDYLDAVEARYQA